MNFKSRQKWCSICIVLWTLKFLKFQLFASHILIEMAHCLTYMQCIWLLLQNLCSNQYKYQVFQFQLTRRVSRVGTSACDSMCSKAPYFSFENLDLHSNHIPLREYQPASQDQRKYMVIANSVGSHKIQKWLTFLDDSFFDESFLDDEMEMELMLSEWSSSDEKCLLRAGIISHTSDIQN